jgi:hypothetical protein
MSGGQWWEEKPNLISTGLNVEHLLNESPWVAAAA